MKQSILDALRTRRLYFDGATGSVLFSRGLAAGVAPEVWNDTHPDEIYKLHREYLLAGADIIKTNTFGINPMKYPDYEEKIKCAVEIAKRATEGLGDKYIALDVGPLGKLIEPLGDLSFEAAVDAFRRTVAAAADACDLILIETISDAYEAKAAVIGAREASSLPIFVSCVFDGRGKLMTGADPAAIIATLESLGVAAVGMNCSQGPDAMAQLAPTFASRASVPVFVNPNAGLPEVREGVVTYNVSAEDFADSMKAIAPYASVLGGCCGTSPEYISALRRATEIIPFTYPEKKNITTVSSYTHAVDFDTDTVLIGERINPTGKPRLKAALRERNLDYILGEAATQADAGAHVLDVNVGLPEIDEEQMLTLCVKEIQSVTDLPLQLDSSDPAALESAMRVYNGKPLVNSVNGKEESLASVLPLVKKYGGALIALTLDEGGIPYTAEGRVAIAEKIIARANELGINTCDIIVDPLCMSVSADPNAAMVTLEAVRQLSKRGIKTSLGVSNVSFGLPARDNINSAFFAEALANGLTAAIMNPHSEPMMNVYRAHRALMGYDADFNEYISHASADTAPRVAENDAVTLKYAIRHGMREAAGAIAGELIKETAPISVIDNEIIPALNEVGAEFECGKAYLPELLKSAEAASAAFDVIKSVLPKSGSNGRGVLLATVKGDIHDIGKNILKVMLESYGFSCTDLGRDVAPELVVAEAKRLGVKLVALSALMTTTVPAMEKTVKLIHESLPGVSVMVGGAVLNPEYAEMIGADFYGKDAMAGVRIAEAFYEGGA